jgi:hypothetical protein
MISVISDAGLVYTIFTNAIAEINILHVIDLPNASLSARIAHPTGPREVVAAGATSSEFL